MKRILENGSNEYKTVCNNCGCIFTYELIDISFGKVQCPYCDTDVIHRCTNVNITNDPECEIKHSDIDYASIKPSDSPNDFVGMEYLAYEKLKQDLIRQGKITLDK